MKKAVILSFALFLLVLNSVFVISQCTDLSNPYCDHGIDITNEYGICARFEKTLGPYNMNINNLEAHESVTYYCSPQYTVNKNHCCDGLTAAECSQYFSTGVSLAKCNKIICAVPQEKNKCFDITKDQCNFARGVELSTCILSNIPTATHKECDANNKCIFVNGSGQDACTDDVSCVVSTDQHNICDNGVCKTVAGSGPNECSSDPECNYKKCVSEECVSVPKVTMNEQDECSVNAECINAPISVDCAPCNMPLGLFGLVTGCSNGCYLERTFTILDFYKNCDNINSCYDYKSEDACNENECNTGPCEWAESVNAYSELGNGICRPVQTTSQDCAKCSGTNFNSIFDICDNEARCHLFGSRCHYIGSSCIATTFITPHVNPIITNAQIFNHESSQIGVAWNRNYRLC